MVAAADATQTSPASDSAEFDPHTPKWSVDDPRLRVQRPPSRRLKMLPVFGGIAAILGLAACAVLLSLRKSNSAPVHPEPPKVSTIPPAAPAFIQQAPSTPDPPPSLPPQPSALPRSNVEQPWHPDVRAQQAMQLEIARQTELARSEAEARNSELFFRSSATSPSAAPSTPLATTPALSASPIQPAAASAAGIPAPATLNNEAFDPNLQTRKNTFLDDPKLRSDYVATALQPALSPYEVKATTIIPATLITGINSDLPGPIIAQVREQVYDTVTGEHLLIPQGARLLASYDSMVAWGQERVLLCWQRLLLPNGKSINLQCMPAADLNGRAGLTDEVDNHWSRLLAAVGLSTVLSLGAQAAAGDPTGYQLSLVQSGARNAAGQINSAGQAVVQRQINIQPTITIRPGFGVNVIVTKDMVLEPYLESGAQ